MGKFINRIKDVLDNAIDALTAKTDEIENNQEFDYETECFNTGFDWESVQERMKRVNPSYAETAEKVKKETERMFANYKKPQDACILLTDEERIEINRLESEKNVFDDAVALDVFGNLIHLGDEVINVDYNDYRCSYISIKKSYKTYAFCDICGSVRRKVLLKKEFDRLDCAGMVTFCYKSGFYHIERPRIDYGR